MTTQAHMHVALRVADLDRSVAFYQALFGTAPAKHFDDYAKFEVLDPPLVFSLNPVRSADRDGDAAAQGLSQGLSHLGVRLPSNEALDGLRSRLDATALELRDEPSTTCCYALQDKLWVTDPDSNEWEFYWLREDTEVHSNAATTCCAPNNDAAGCC